MKIVYGGITQCGTCGAPAHPGLICGAVPRVTSKPEIVTRQFEPDPAVVKFVEELLEHAKSGKMRAIAVAVVYHNDLVPDGEADHGWAAIAGTVHWALDRAIHRLYYFLSLIHI